MHVNIKYKTTQILQSRSMPRQYFLQTKESRQMIKDTWKVAGQGSGSLPQGHCIFVMRIKNKPLLKILETWRQFSTTIDPGNCLAFKLTTLNSMSFFFSFSAEVGKREQPPPDTHRACQELGGLKWTPRGIPQSSGAQRHPDIRQFTCSHAVHKPMLQGPATHICFVWKSPSCRPLSNQHPVLDLKETCCREQVADSRIVVLFAPLSLKSTFTSSVPLSEVTRKGVSLDECAITLSSKPHQWAGSENGITTGLIRDS